MNEARERFAEKRRVERRERRREEYRRGLRPAAIAAWNISKDHNVGTLVRTAHAAAFEEVILVGTRDWNVEAAKTADLYTSVIHVEDQRELLYHCRKKGWNIVAVELDDEAENLFEVSYAERPCFLLGAELGGLPQELRDASTQIVQIPQWGLVPCLNLAVAGSIVVYDFLAKCARSGRLDRPSGGLVPGEP
jgi:tRNA G18 (ribose-2'-O)-methylase SpoU